MTNCACYCHAFTLSQRHCGECGGIEKRSGMLPIEFLTGTNVVLDPKTIRSVFCLDCQRTMPGHELETHGCISWEDALNDLKRNKETNGYDESNGLSADTHGGG